MDEPAAGFHEDDRPLMNFPEQAPDVDFHIQNHDMDKTTYSEIAPPSSTGDEDGSHLSSALNIAVLQVPTVALSTAETETPKLPEEEVTKAIDLAGKPKIQQQERRLSNGSNIPTFKHVEAASSVNSKTSKASSRNSNFSKSNSEKSATHARQSFESIVTIQTENISLRKRSSKDLIPDSGGRNRISTEDFNRELDTLFELGDDFEKELKEQEDRKTLNKITRMVSRKEGGGDVDSGNNDTQRMTNDAFAESYSVSQSSIGSSLSEDELSSASFSSIHSSTRHFHRSKSFKSQNESGKKKKTKPAKKAVQNLSTRSKSKKRSDKNSSSKFSSLRELYDSISNTSETLLKKLFVEDGKGDSEEKHGHSKLEKLYKQHFSREKPDSTMNGLLKRASTLKKEANGYLVKKTSTLRGAKMAAAAAAAAAATAATAAATSKVPQDVDSNDKTLTKGKELSMNSGVSLQSAAVAYVKNTDYKELDEDKEVAGQDYYDAQKILKTELPKRIGGDADKEKGGALSSNDSDEPKLYNIQNQSNINGSFDSIITFTSGQLVDGDFKRIPPESDTRPIKDLGMQYIPTPIDKSTMIEKNKHKNTREGSTRTSKKQSEKSSKEKRKRQQHSHQSKARSASAKAGAYATSKKSSMKRNKSITKQLRSTVRRNTKKLRFQLPSSDNDRNYDEGLSLSGSSTSELELVKLPRPTKKQHKKIVKKKKTNAKAPILDRHTPKIGNGGSAQRRSTSISQGGASRKRSNAKAKKPSVNSSARGGSLGKEPAGLGSVFKRLTKVW